jgi:hypothetical protein
VRAHLRDHGVDEQRIPIGAGMDRRGEPRRDLRAWKTRLEIARDVGLREIVHGELVTLPAQAQPADHVGQAVLLHGDVRRPVGPDHHQPRRLTTLAEQRQQIERRRIAPVQVLEHEHECHRPGQLLRQHGKLAQHAFGSGRVQGTAQLIITVAEQPRQLRQPGRRDATQQAGQIGAMRQSGEAFGGFEHRHVWLARSELLDTTTAADPHRRGGSEECIGGEERFDERRLADPGRARHEDDLALARDGSLEERLQSRELDRTADERSRRDGLGHRHRPHLMRCADEAKAAAMNRLDEGRRLGVVAQRDAQLADRLRQRVRRDCDVTPDGVQQLVFRDEHAGTLDEVEEDRPRLRPQWYSDASPGELAPTQIEAESSELDGVAPLTGRHHGSSQSPLVRIGQRKNRSAPLHGSIVPTMPQYSVANACFRRQQVVIEQAGRSL